MRETVKNTKEIGFISKVASAFDKLEKSLNPIGDVDSGASNWDMEIKAFLDGHTLKGLFYSEDWVYICCDVVASKIASQQMMVYKKEVIDGETVYTPAPEHVLNERVQNPNRAQDYYNWMYSQVVDHTLMGNAIIWDSRANGVLIILPAENVDLLFEKDELKKYQFYKTDELSTQIATTEFPVDEVLHIKRPNPSCVYWGLSPFIPTRKATLFNRYTSDYLNGFYLKNALPGMALHLEKQVNEDGLLKLLRTFEKAYTGRKNQRRTLVIPKGVKAEPLIHNIGDQKLVDLVKMNRETILNSLRVPKHELSLAETGSLGSEEHKMALRNFWASTLIPIMNSIAGAYTKFFSKDLGEGFEFRFDVSNVEALRDDEFKKAELSEKLLKTHTLNEVRSKLYKMEAIEGGDATPGQQQNPFGQFMGSSQQETTEPITDEDENKSMLLRARESRLSSHKDVIDMTLKSQGDDLKEKEEAVIKRVFELYGEMFDKTITTIKKVIKDEKAAGREMTAEEKRKLKNELVEAYNDLENGWVDWQRKELASVVVSNFDIALKPIKFNDIARDEVEAIKLRNLAKQRLILSQRGLKTFDSIANTKAEEVLRVVEAGMNQGKTIDQVALDISERFKDEDVTIGKAKTIARTEILTANSLGKAAAMETAVEVLGEDNVEKMWITMLDDDVRDSHQELHGEIREYKEEFKNDLSFPRDPRAEGSETINCFVYDTAIESNTISHAMRSFYKGNVIDLMFSDNSRLVGTPNHPILTTRGWIALRELNKGDKIIKASLRNPVISINSYIERVESSIGEIFDSFNQSSNLMRIPSSIVNFHGDIPNSDIDIIDVNSLLPDRIKTFSNEEINNISFDDSNFRKSFLFGNSGFYKSIDGTLTSKGIIGGKDLRLSLVDGHLTPFEFLRIASSSLSESVVSKIISDTLSRDSTNLTDLVNANIFIEMKIVEVSNIVIRDFSSHVYNISTNEGWYLANGVVSRNCRCDLLLIPKNI